MKLLRGCCWVVVIAAVVQVGCKSAPVTGRKQMLLVPESQEVSLGLTSFEDVTKKEPPSQNAKYIEIVNRVGQRIAAAADKPDYQWEFKVIASATQNAFCLPGGKVAVYEGILPVCSTEAGLAVVMSHEVAHALARHGGERMSQNMVVDKGKEALSYLTQSQTETKKAIIGQAYGLGTQYGVLLPYSRAHESEADHIGIMLMARAGYDPQEAPRFWTRFSSAKKEDATVQEFMSTHPSDERRSRDLAELVPEALNFYQQAPHRYGMGETIQIPLPSAAPAVAAAPPAGAPAAMFPTATNNAPALSTAAAPAGTNAPATSTPAAPALSIPLRPSLW